MLVVPPTARSPWRKSQGKDLWPLRHEDELRPRRSQFLLATILFFVSALLSSCDGDPYRPRDGSQNPTPTPQAPDATATPSPNSRTELSGASSGDLSITDNTEHYEISLTLGSSTVFIPADDSTSSFSVEARE